MPVTIEAPSPPRKATAAKASASPGKSTMTRKATERAEGLAGIGQLVYAALLFARQPADAGAMDRHFPAVAVEVAKLGDSNQKIGDALDKLNEIGPYAGLITAVTPLIAQILVNHDRIPVTSVASLGVVSKSTLESEVQTQILQAEMHAMQVAMEAQEQAERIRAEWEKASSQNGTASDRANGLQAQ